MLTKNKDLLTQIQVAILMVAGIMGVGVLYLPRKAVELSNSGAVALTLISGIIAIGLSCLILYLNNMFPNKTIFDYSKDIVGNFISKLIALFLFAHFILISTSILRTFADTVKVYLLENTPTEVIVITMLILIAYLTQNGIVAIAKLCEVFFLITIIFGLLILLLSMENIDVNEIICCLKFKGGDLVRGIPESLFFYSGFEILFIVGAFAAKPAKLKKSVTIGIGIVILLYIATVIIGIGVFSVEGLKYTIYPTLELAKAIVFPGAFAERFDILFAISWITAVFTSLALAYYSAMFSITRLIGLKSYKPFSYILMPFLYLTTLAPSSINSVMSLNTWNSYFQLIVIVIIPISLLLIAFIRGKGGRSSEKA